MEQAKSPLSHKGSISEAITESLTHKKLFVVFISGDDDSSKRLEQSTLVDERVEEFVLKCCVFLHLHAGTADAAQFSAIYPQKSTPSISIVGYNGVMAFQHDGFIAADSFLESVKKAWESMQLQEATAALLTAALASTGDAPSTSGGKSDQEPDEKNSSNDDYRVSTSVHVEEPHSSGIEKKANPVELTDVNLSIRLPNGSRLQLSSPLTDTLESVKKHVLDNADSDVGAFDLAVPYPRKLFTDQDMSQPLSDLGFSSREALIVVPRKHVDMAPINVGALHRDNEGGGGYFALLKRILSFANPLSYLGGASQTSTPVQTPRNPYRDEQSSPTYSSSGSRSRAPARFGGNIHTLRDMEREDPSGEKNLFWNGNSTEFGGDDQR